MQQIDPLLASLIISCNDSSGGERVSIFVRDYLTNNIGVGYSVDDIGNIYVYRENTPLLCAHMDSVFDDKAPISSLRLIAGKLSGDGNLGADDIVGIYIILSLLRERHDFSVLFTVEEEMGMLGAKNIVYELSDHRYAVIVDRNGSSDIIGYKNRYCSRSFNNAVYSALSVLNYRPATGYICDADVLRQRYNCVNLSCGYYAAHTEGEYIKISDVDRCISAVRLILDIM